MSNRTTQRHLHRESAGLRLVIVTCFAGLVVTGSCGAAADLAPAPERVFLAPATLSLTIGKSDHLTASLFGPDGRTVPGATFIWSNSSPGIVSLSPDGNVFALGAGTAQVVATHGTVSATAVVTVTYPPVPDMSFSVSSTRNVLWVNDTLTAVARLRIDGSAAIPQPAVSWSSSRPEILEVSQAGVLRGIAPGVSVITAQSGKLSASLSMTVVAIGTLRIQGAQEIAPGWEAPLAMRGTTGESYAGPVQWTTSDSTIATVSSGGVMQALRLGVATIHGVAAGQALDLRVTVRALAGRIGVARNGALTLMSLDETHSVSIPQRDGASLVWPHMTLSPDGREVAFDCGLSVCKAPVDAPQRVELLLEKGTFPSWTGDGKTIVARTDYAEVGVFDIATGRLARIRTFIYVDRPRVSPDGTNIAYDCDYSNPYDSLDDICNSSVGANRSGNVLVQYGTRVAWANDGTRIAYLAAEGVCVAPATPQPPCTPVLPGNEDHALTEIVWSPDSKHLLIARGRELWIVDPDGNNRTRQLSATYGFTSPSWSASP